MARKKEEVKPDNVKDENNENKNNHGNNKITVTDFLFFLFRRCMVLFTFFISVCIFVKYAFLLLWLLKLLL